MPLPQGRRDDCIGQLFTHDLIPRIAEGSLRGRIELYDVPLVVNRDDAIECSVQDRGLARLTLPKRCVALRTFNSDARDMGELGDEILLLPGRRPGPA